MTRSSSDPRDRARPSVARRPRGSFVFAWAFALGASSLAACAWFADADSLGDAHLADGGTTSSASGGSNGAPASDGGAGTVGGSSGSSGAGSGGAGSGGAGQNGAPAVDSMQGGCAGSSLTCGNGEDCCASISVPGGTVLLGRSYSGADACPPNVTCNWWEQPERPSNVAPFHLDEFDVTVGRFRRFLAAYDSWSRPGEGDGATTADGFEQGWKASWNESVMPFDRAVFVDENHLTACERASWSEVGQDDYPITCVDWFEALAFCIWDGGRLPTTREWEFAAAAGKENRLYPWGADPPDSLHANYGCDHEDYSCGLQPVGSFPAGAGAYGHQDLAGNVAQWALDIRFLYDQSECVACDQTHITRGTGWDGPSDQLRSAYYVWEGSQDRFDTIGFRCAR